jgi:hypothetical protein
MKTTTAPIGGSERPRRARRWPRRLALGGALTIVLFVFVGFFVLPPVARSVAQKQLGELLGRKVSIARVRMNPLTLSVTIEGFEIFEADGTTPFVGFSRLHVNAQMSSIFRRAPVIEEVALESPRVHVVRTKTTPEAFADVDAAYNFSDILKRLAARTKTPEPPPTPDAAPPRFSLNNLHLSDGTVIFDDRPTGHHHEITDLTVGVPFVSTLPVYLDAFVEPGLSVRIDGTTFVAQGRTKPFTQSLETVLELRLQGLDLTPYVPFVPMRLPFAVESARLSVELDVAFVRAAADAPRLTVKGTIGVEDVDVIEKHKTGPRPLLALKKLEIAIGEIDLGAQRFHLDKILIAGLQLHVRREHDGTLNLEHMIPEAPHPEAKKRKEKERERAKHAEHEEKAGPRFTLDHFALEDATIHFRDETVEPSFETTVRDLSVTVRGLSNAPGATAHESARLHVTPDLRLTQEGTLRLTPLEAKGKVKVEGIEPARFATYCRDLVAFDVERGHLALGGDYLFEEIHGRTTLRLSDAFVELGDVALRRRGAGSDFFQLGDLSVHGAAVDLAEHTVKIAEVSTHSGHLRAARDANGVVDLSTLVPPRATATRTAATPAKAETPAAPTTSASASPTEAQPPWTVSLARFELDGWGARFDDRAVAPSATLTVDPIALHLTNVSTAPGAKVGMDLRVGINKTGKLQMTGTSTLPPVAANVRFELRALEILPLQPYFHDDVSLTVTGGTVSLKGQATVNVGAGPSPRLNVTTDLDVADLATVDRDKQEALLKWKAFHVGGLHVTTPPTAVAIDDVSFTDFESRLILSPDARFNLQDALAPPGITPTHAPAAAPPNPKKGAPRGQATAKAAAAPADASTPITIKRITLQGGQIAFRDRMIHPSYAADLTDLAGRVTGLSSSPDTTADIDLRGSVNRSGVLSIVGKANPLAKDLNLDVAVSLKDFELPPTSPYAGKYAGYAISKGKLDLSLAYKIAHGKLDAQNELVLDQFTFGDKVESSTAVKLPLRLAVALLKDRHGVIDINLPIAGSLDDPEFKIWPAVWKVLGHLVLKAATEPFALIASAFGGGDDVSKIVFPPGAATLDGAAQKRLGVLAKVLGERPGVSFEIGGEADPKHEREQLRRYLFERKLKATRIAELVKTAAAVPAALDDLALDPSDRPRLLVATYKSETFPKPTNGIGLEKSLAPAEMEKLMLVNTNVDDDQLRALAQRRATAVQTVLAKAVMGAAGRLYLVAPRLGASGGRVELKLKKD